MGHEHVTPEEYSKALEEAHKELMYDPGQQQFRRSGVMTPAERVVSMKQEF